MIEDLAKLDELDEQKLEKFLKDEEIFAIHDYSMIYFTESPPLQCLDRTPIYDAEAYRLHEETPRYDDPEARRQYKLERARQKWADPKHRTKMCKLISERTILLWQNPIWRDNQIKVMRLGLQIHPNKPEMQFLALLKSVTPEWEFVGDGKKIIAGKNPDFWNGNHKLAELFGNYWHKGENPAERINLFRQYGYNTLVIWESELENPQEVLTKVAEFIS